MSTATKRETQATEGQGAEHQQPAQASSQTTQTLDETIKTSMPSARTDEGEQGFLTNASAETLARGLGWFSIGLGLAELLAPRGIAKISGIRGNTNFIRLMGLREIGHGIAIFAQGRKPATALWARVAGDALDLAALGGAFASPDSNKGKLTFATANVLAVTALDVLCAQQMSSSNDTAGD
jgi:hypothetical protein